MGKIRILFLITDLAKGGAERFLIDLCTELKKREDVHFIIGSLFDNNQYSYLTGEFEIVNLNYTPFSLFKKNEYPEYKNLLEEFKPHIIHTHRFLAEFLSAFYVSPDTKYVCHGHDNMIQFNNFSFYHLLNKKKILNYCEKKILMSKKMKNEKNYFFITNSTHTHAYFQKVLPKSINEQIFLLNYGFNFDRFYKDTPNTLPKQGPIKLINIGSFQKKKNQIFIIAIAKELNKLNIPFEIHLLGDGELKNKVSVAVHANKLKDKIFIHGNVDNVEKWLWNSHIYLHTALYEPFGLVFLEAMAAGLPCVALDGKGNRDLIQNDLNGYLIYQQDAKRFALVIKNIISNSDLFRSLSENAKTFSKQFDITGKAEEYVSFYKSIIKPT